jgi:DNA-binding CsgD family transcriptional regulator
MNRKHTQLPLPGTYKYPHPVTGKPVSRQRIYQLRNIEMGLCITCGGEKDTKKQQCDACAKKANISMRQDERKERIANINWLKTNKEIADELDITCSYVSRLRYDLNTHRDKVIEDTLLWLLYCADVKAYTDFRRWFSSLYRKQIDFLVYRKRVVIVDDDRTEGICVIPIDKDGEYIQWCQLTFSN